MWHAFLPVFAMQNNEQTPKKKRKRTWLIVLLSLVILLLIFRLILPHIVLNFVNKKLAALKEYYGHVDDIDIALIRGAYTINNIKIEKIDKETGKRDTTPFFTSPEIDLSVEWKSLFKGAIVGEIQVEHPVLNFVKGKHKKEDVKADTTDFKDLIRNLMPLTINHFDIHNGQMHYLDKYRKPVVDVAMTNIEVEADNISNVNDRNKVLPAAIVASANVYDGKFDLNVKYNVLEKKPTFDLNAKLSDVNMVKLNDFFKAYGNFDVKKGNFGLYTEFAARDGKFTGYVKPLIKGLDVVQFNKEEGNAGQILWESVVASVAEIFQNQKKDQLATKVPIEGKFDNPNAGLWTAINYVLRNAFVFALKPAVDNTINIGSVEEQPDEKKTLLQKIFGKKDKRDEDGKEKKEEGKGK
jgi:hypothetical protein